MMMLQVSRDGGNTWGSERWCGAGEIGEYRKRVIWRRLGAADDFVIKFRWTEPCKLAVLGSWINT
jgi:hypothetical protein